MNPTDFYRALVNAIDDDDAKRAALILAEHVGEANSITLEQLAVRIYGAWNASTERKTRIVLERLVKDFHLPVGARSGKNGRWLCADDEERERVAADLDNRIRETQERARCLRMAQVPPQAPKFEKAVQASLFA